MALFFLKKLTLSCNLNIISLVQFKKQNKKKYIYVEKAKFGNHSIILRYPSWFENELRDVICVRHQILGQFRIKEVDPRSLTLTYTVQSVHRVS